MAGCLLVLTTFSPGAAARERAAAATPDPWWGRDKALHFGASAGIAAGGYALSALVWEKPWQRALGGGALALSAGAGKELYDLAGGGDPSLKDLAWDAIGTGAGLGLALAADVLLFGGGGSAPRRAETALVLRW